MYPEVYKTALVEGPLHKDRQREGMGNPGQGLCAYAKLWGWNTKWEERGHIQGWKFSLLLVFCPLLVPLSGKSSLLRGPACFSRDRGWGYSLQGRAFRSESLVSGSTRGGVAGISLPDAQREMRGSKDPGFCPGPTAPCSGDRGQLM